MEMQKEIYKITLTDLSKLAGLADFYEYKSALSEIKVYLKSDFEESKRKQNNQNIKFVVRLANRILSIKNETVHVAMIYFLNLYIERHYDYSLEYDWQQLKPLLLLTNFLITTTNFKSFGKQILNPHLHVLLKKYAV